MAEFEATRHGVCHNPACGTGEVKVGQAARYIPGEVGLIEHVACPPEPKAPVVCLGCHMALPATGECDDCG